MLVTILIYIAILVVKMIEVSMATVRIVLITKGERFKGAIIGFFEVLIWVILVSFVLDDITSDPIKVIIYALGFSLGNYLGSIVEQKLGFGTIKIETIVLKEHGKELSKYLRSKGFAVTVVDAIGMNHAREILIMHVARRKVDNLIKEIRDHQENAVITINEVKPIYGGYNLLRK